MGGYRLFDLNSNFYLFSFQDSIWDSSAPTSFSYYDFSFGFVITYFRSFLKANQTFLSGKENYFRHRHEQQLTFCPQ